MRLKLCLALLCLSAAIAPGGALAASDPPSANHGHEADSSHGGGDAGHAAEEGKSPLLSFDPGTAIWSIIVFVLLLIVLRVAAWKPILQALQQREAFIRESLDQARKDREAAEQHAKEYAAQIDKTRDEAEAIVAEARRDGEVVRLKLKEQAENEAEAILERAKREIEVARSTAIKDIYEAGAQLAAEAAGKILGREVSAADHERLIAESIEQLASRRN